VLPHGTLMFVQGSTGGAGLRALQATPPTPLECAVLYFDRGTHRLQAWDDITLAGLGGADVQIQRHLVTGQQPTPGLTPGPGQTPGTAPAQGTTSAPGTSPTTGVGHRAR
jgi:hypothetical protein